MRRILINLKDELLEVFEKIGRNHNLMHKYAGKEMISYSAVVRYLIKTHPEVRQEIGQEEG